MLLPVILAGGVGDRLWPLSRSAHPKQFLSLINPDQTLLQATLSRLTSHNFMPPLILSQETHRFILAQQLKACGIEPTGILLEPLIRNTAAAIALAAHFAKTQYPKATLLILPADHILEKSEVFFKTLESLAVYAKQGYLITFGIKPNRPETGYGYIKIGHAISSTDNLFKIAAFKEKPDLNTAENFLKTQEYLWNSGMFLFTPKAYLRELSLFYPDIVTATASAMADSQKTNEVIYPKTEHFKKATAISIDYAVMEKTQKAAAFPLDIPWNDVGNFNALWQQSQKDENNNKKMGNTCLVNTKDCYVYSQKRLISTLDVNNLTIIETPDAVLVANRHSAQDIKNIVNKLKAQNKPEANHHIKITHAWGSEEMLGQSDYFRVKKIFVDPFQRLPLEKHENRSEHWIILKGKANITCGEKIFTLTDNETTYIAPNIKHGLENLTKKTLSLIEIQSGACLNEEDVIRYEDQHGHLLSDTHNPSY